MLNLQKLKLCGRIVQGSHFTDCSVIKEVLNKSKFRLRIDRLSKLSVKEERKIIDIIK